MSDLFDLSNFDKYKEDNCREVKKAEGGLPIALWESYSSFANSNGGVIILGVGERQDGTWYTTGLKNADKLKRNFWNTIHDTKKVRRHLHVRTLPGKEDLLPSVLPAWKEYQHPQTAYGQHLQQPYGR